MPSIRQRRYRVGPPRQAGTFHPQVLAGMADGLTAPQPGHDVQELGAPLVALGLAEEVAVRLLLGGLAAGHDVEQQAPGGVALVRGRHLRGQRGRYQTGPEGDEELQSLGDLGEHASGQPRVLAPRAGRGEGRLEAELLGAAGDLAQVPERGRTDAAGRAGGDAVATADDVTAVAVGGQEPVEVQRHPVSSRNPAFPIVLLYIARWREDIAMYPDGAPGHAK